ncbi:hypothetical protein MKW94_017453 [Papaver nudicaule]|uniref:Dof zinc finger protein n=1 Tax=Papaver nudicaule TaxID=74823 RepID=A0AA41VHR0_PAPNU|nr:hypothetical protein [Papaver nudicaule]
MEDMKGLQQQQQQQQDMRSGGVMKQQSQQQILLQENPQPQQPQKCPRCESLNTKFCYYNNYSLSQPRYFCKGCRRYWTQGGTLRNVPVGGGCRKGKRSTPNKKPTASSSAATPTHDQQNPSQNSAPKALLMSSSAANPSPSYYYPGAGGGSVGAPGIFLSSLAPFQSFNQQIPINANSDHNNIGISSSALLQGFYLPTFQLQQKQQQHQQLQPHSQYLNMGGTIKEEKPILPLEAGNLRPPSTQHHHQEWFLPNFNSNNPIGTSEGVNYWDSQPTTTTNNNDSTATVSTTDGTTTTMNPPSSTTIQHHWSDLGGSYGTATNAADQPSSPPPSLL